MRTGERGDPPSPLADPEIMKYGEKRTKVVPPALRDTPDVHEIAPDVHYPHAAQQGVALGPLIAQIKKMSAS